MSNIEIFVTLGPSSLNRDFLTYINNKKVSLVRLNMSHLNTTELKKKIIYLKKNCKIPICIDTEGAQIRTKLRKIKNIVCKKNKIVIISKNKGLFSLYPNEVFTKLKKGDILDVGFQDLKLKVVSKSEKNIKTKCIVKGILQGNKGVHVINRKIDLNYLTEKDFKAIEIGKNFGIKNYALSFTNSKKDIINFSKILPSARKIFKIETLQGLKNLNFFLKKQNNFLIDRGDLSKDVGITNIPLAQRKIFKISKKFKKAKIAVATNFLESMIDNAYPTRAEVNDIYNALEMGASGLVLAAETAIGKYPKECVELLFKIINVYKKNN